MENCYIKSATNPGVESELYKTIYDNIAFGDEEKANELYAHFFTTTFKRQFGDWVTDYKKALEVAEKNKKLPKDQQITYRPVISQSLVNDIGEPILMYEEDSQRYYYKDKYKQKRYFPLFQAGLLDIFSHSYVLEASRALAHDYVIKHTDLDFETLNITKVTERLHEAIRTKLRDKVEEFKEKAQYYRDKAEAETDEVEKEYLEEDAQYVEDQADRIEESMAYINEWKEYVEDYFREIKIVYTEVGDDLDIQEKDENNRDRAFDEASWERSTKEGISANVKLRLSLLTHPDKRDAVFDDPVFIPFDEIYGNLLEHLNTKVSVYKGGFREDVFKLQVAAIAELGKKKSYFSELAKMLNNKDLSEDIKNEFFQAFNVDKNHYVTTQIREQRVRATVNKYFTFLDLTNVGSRSKMIEGNWYANFGEKFLNKDNGLTDKGREALEAFMNGTESSTGFNQVVKNLKRDVDLGKASGVSYLEKVSNYLIDKWQDIGIELNQEGEGFTHFLDKLKEDNDGDVDNITKELVMAFDATRDVIQKVLDGEIKTDSSPFSEQSLFNTLAEAEAFFLPEGADASIFTGGKSKWIYSYPSYLSTKVKEWKADPEELFNRLDTVSGRSSRWAKYLTGEDLIDVDDDYKAAVVKQRMRNFHLTIFNTFQKENDAANANDYKDIAKNDFYADSYNKILNSKPHYSTPVPADKGSLYQIQIDYAVEANARGNKEKGYNVNQEVLDIFYEYFRSEYDRIKQVQAEIEANLDEEGKPIDPNAFRMYYHGTLNEDGTWNTKKANGLKSQIFPSLSSDKFDGKIAGFELYDSNGKPIAELPPADTFAESELRDKIQASLKNLIVKKILDTQKTLFDKGILELSEKGEIINHGLDAGVFSRYEGDPLTIAGDIFVNGAISQIEFSKLFSGDVAYYKNTVDYKKRVPETYTDGLGLRLYKEDDEFFNVAVVENIERSSPFYDQLVEMLGKDLADNYVRDLERGKGGINSADAQAWISPQRWAFLVRRTGKWNDTYQSAYQKMMYGTEQGFTKEELKAVAQPLKGVYFELNNGVPTYLKYSQAVLVPNLVKGTSLEHLYNKMVYNEDGSKKKFKDQIHEIVTLDGIKVGPPVPASIHDGNGGFKADAKLTPIALKNTGWKLQQNLPTKTFKPTDIGSQLEKNIYGGLSNNLDEMFQVGDEEMTGADLIDHINNLMNALREKGKNKLTLQFGVTPSGKMQNYDRVYEALADDLRSRKGGNRNVIEALKAGMSPYGIPSAQKTLTNIFASIFTRELVKVKTNGGAFVQLSNFGISKPPKGRKDNTGIIWSPKIKEGDTTSEPVYLRDDEGNIIYTKSGKPRVQAGGIIISGSFIAKYIPDYRKYSPEQLFGKYNPKTGEYRGGKIDGRILQGLVGYRIPNQALASNDALEIVGIAPEEVGDTVIAYTGITTKTGSDFDIDKMYIMMPEFYPIRKDANRIRDYVFQKLRGKDFKETLANTKNLIGSLNKEALEKLEAEAVTAENLTKDMEASKDLKQVQKAADVLIEILLDEETISANPLAQEIREQSNLATAEKLQYVTPDYDEYTMDDIDPETGEVIIKKEYVRKDYNLQSKKALANMLMQAYQAVLLNPKVIKEVMTPIDFDFIKDDINSIHKKPAESDLDVFDVSSDVELKYEFMAGKAGVGMEANAYVDHIRGTMANLKFHQHYIGWGNQVDGESVMDREFSEKLSDSEIKYYLKVINEGREPNDKLGKKDIEKIKIAYSLSAVLNAFVDIAKDPYITRGNWTTQTTNVGNMMLRLGVHPFKVNAFLGQPMIKQYVEYVVNKESKINQDSGDLKNKFRLEMVHKKLREDGRDIDMGVGDPMSYEDLYKAIVKKGPGENEKGLYDSAISKITPQSIAEVFGIPGDDLTEDEIRILNDYVQDLRDIHNEVFKAAKVNVTGLTLQEMREQIVTGGDSNTQLAMLNKFFDLQKMTKDIRNNITASRSDVNGYGKNISSMTVLMNTLNKLLSENANVQKGLKGFREKLIKDGKKTALGGITENMQWVQKIMQNNPFFFFMSNPYIINTFNEVSIDVHNDILTNEQLGTKLEAQYYSYMMSHFPPLQIDSDEEMNDLVFKFVKKLKKFKKDNDIEEGDYKILDELYPKRSAGGTSYLAMSNRRKSPSEQSQIIASWNDLLEDYPEMGEELIRYAYVTTGFNMSVDQFFTYVPYQWFLKHNIDFHIMDMSNRINKLNQSGTAVDDIFIRQLYLNNIEDDQLVPRVHPSQIAINFKTAGFVLDKLGKARRYVKKVTESKEINPETGKKTVTTTVYQLVGYTKEGNGIYLQSPKLGLRDPKGFKIYEYLFDTDFDSSFKYNRAKIMSNNAENVNKLLELKEQEKEAYDDVPMVGEINFEKEVEDKLNCKNEE